MEKQTKQQRIEELEAELARKDIDIDELADKVDLLEGQNSKQLLNFEKSRNQFEKELGTMFTRLGALIPRELREKIDIAFNVRVNSYHIRDNEMTLAAAMGYLLAKANLDTKAKGETTPLHKNKE